MERGHAAGGRVVVGVDGTLSGLRALRWAVTEARVRQVPLHAVRVWNGVPRYTYPDPDGQREAETQAASQLVARAFAETLGGLPADIRIETVLIPGSPGPALQAYASQGEGLLVLGAAHRSLWRRWFGDHTVQHCLAHATCPVLVVPPPSMTRAASPRSLLRELRRDLDHLASDGSAT
jgi:nucleotide-binding universal stress UspA family protein